MRKFLLITPKRVFLHVFTIVTFIYISGSFMPLYGEKTFEAQISTLFYYLTILAIIFFIVCIVYTLFTRAKKT